MNKIYMDHAATTYVSQNVLNKMLPYFSEIFGNPSSVHAFGRKATTGVEKARQQVATALGANSNEIIFTAGGSEANNTFIKSVAASNFEKKGHIITSQIEHHAVLHPCEQLEKQGYSVTYLAVDKYGFVSPKDVEAAITPQTILVSIMFANNEIGTIQPIKEISKITKAHKILFHTDAVQAIGAVPIDVKDLGVDALSLSGHKFYGPKGVGALFVRKGIRVDPLISGGAQERNRRGGTENLAGIVGLGEAIEIATTNIEEKNKKLIIMRDKLFQNMLEKIEECSINGHPTNRLPNNFSMCFRYIEGEALLLSLDLVGVAGSSGSACTSGSLEPSHVLLATGLSHEVAHGSLRLSLGEINTMEQVEYVSQELVKIVEKLRKWSPLYNN